MTHWTAPAKINLWLHVFPPDYTGYHPLDTLFCALDLVDEISLDLSGDGIQLQVTGADVGPPERNLAYRAALEFFHATKLPPRVAIDLHKYIPVGAGLGGGSSDAATVLHALNELHDDVLPLADLMAMAGRLGSDVPFFLCGSSLAHATGRGEVLRALSALPPKPALIVLPNFAISTADAYRLLDKKKVYARSPVGPLASSLTWDDIHAENTFESALFAKHPELQTVRDTIRASGARMALLSGSGSAVFGIYDSVDERDEAAQLNWTPGARVLYALTQP